MIAGRIGASLAAPEPLPPHAFWFGEDQGRYLVAVEDDGAGFAAAAQEAGVAATVLGAIGGAALTVAGGQPISITDLQAAHDGWLVSYMSAGATG